MYFIFYIHQLLMLFLLYLYQIDSISHYHLKEYAINHTSISITGFAYSPNKKPPEWVEKTFGSQAVFWQVKGEYFTVHGGLDQVEGARKRWRNFMELPFSAMLPACSIEMIGYARLGADAPFRGKEDRKQHPSAGTAILSSKKFKVTCYYRGLYSNARNADVPGAFWTVMFYCPILTTKSNDCKSFENQYKNNSSSVSYQLHMKLIEVTWYQHLITFYDGKELNKKPIHPPPDYHMNIYEDGSSHQHSTAHGVQQHSTLHEVHESLAICTTWPFYTNDEKKILINQAMVYEFMRYYANLGIKVIIYDREGKNANGMMNSAYVKANPSFGRYKNAIKRHVIYYNYTIHQLLQKPEIDLGIKAEYLQIYGDTETSKREEIHREMFNNDRGLTYSHCRFEARNKYGITRVITADHDEFLFCKYALSTPHSQISYIHSYLNQLEKEGLDQIMFGKTTIAPRTFMKYKKKSISVKECITSEIMKNIKLIEQSKDFNEIIKKSNRSFVQLSTGVGPITEIGNIFKCYASIDYIDEIPNVKSIHLNNGCPFSCVHHGCVPFEFEYKGYDCICTTKRLVTCDFIHLSIVQNKFGFTKYDDQEVMSKYSELYYIANAVD